MTAAIDPVDLAQRLIACPSITPASGAVFDVLDHALSEIGFAVHRFTAGEAPDGPVENMFALRGSSGPHLAFAGHLDVVPPGDGWTSDPFLPEIRGTLLYGRGAVDMKSAIAAFVAAASRCDGDAGTLSFIITGDEEGPAIHGTRALIDHIEAVGAQPDCCLVGEPTSAVRLGDTLKIGRRGSVNIWITVPGIQGHVAYPHNADNPIPRLVRVLARLDAITLDAGTDWFQASNLEVTDLAVGNPATNVIPGAAQARLSIRFNDLHSGEALAERVRRIVLSEAPEAIIDARISGEAFLSPPGAFAAIVSEAVAAETGITPKQSTSGGTSDARFLHRLCPIVEFGLTNATMHKLDEAVAIDDIVTLTAIYERIVRGVTAAD